MSRPRRTDSEGKRTRCAAAPEGGGGVVFPKLLRQAPLLNPFPDFTSDRGVVKRCLQSLSPPPNKLAFSDCSCPLSGTLRRRHRHRRRNNKMIVCKKEIENIYPFEDLELPVICASKRYLLFYLPFFLLLLLLFTKGGVNREEIDRI